MKNTKKDIATPTELHNFLETATDETLTEFKNFMNEKHEMKIQEITRFEKNGKTFADFEMLQD